MAQRRKLRREHLGRVAVLSYRTRLLTAILAFLFLANVFDPRGTLGLKYFALLLAALSTVWTVKYFDLSTRALVFGLIFFVIWPGWSLLYGVVRGGDLYVGLGQVTPFVFAWVLAFLLPALDVRRLLRAFYACLLLLAVVVIAVFALVAFLPDTSVGQFLFGYFTILDGQVGWFQTQLIGGVEVPWIYFTSTLFLVPAFVYYLFIGRLWRAGVILLALAMAFSKAGLTIGFVFGAIYSVSALFKNSPAGVPKGARAPLRLRFRKFLPAVIIAGVAFLIFLSLPAFLDEIADSWAGNSVTAEVRIGHFRSVMDLFLQHPDYLLIGQGAGVPFFSLGTSDYVQSFEIDYLNAIRKFGLPWFIGYSSIVFYSARKLIKVGQMEERAFGFALISSYFASGTNPVLLSSLFVTLLMLSYFAQRRCAVFSGAQNGRVSSATGLPLPQPDEAGA